MRSTQLQSRLTIVTLFDLAPGGVYHAFFVTKKAVSSYLTFSPLPYKFQLRRFIFCGTFPRVAPAGYYPAPLSCGARTFLFTSKAVIQLSGSYDLQSKCFLVKLMFLDFIKFPRYPINLCLTENSSNSSGQ